MRLLRFARNDKLIWSLRGDPSLRSVQAKQSRRYLTFLGMEAKLITHKLITHKTRDIKVPQ
ncbi:hypothetical protein TH606_08540 [Thermodesulfatator autotrophicus]|uniref:Uncharacterized protein n=1 Tax=Thermodesulfatator autotrophicus TaxID=1795632 RepID=A0A177E609_9BACT|nr:hypothetical protein TH606_08540 [Thermodesulfatator autotrophicus]